MGAQGTAAFRTLAARTIGNYVVFVHGSLAPSPSEWNLVLDMYRSHPHLGQARTLVYTEGGAPSAGQRADLSSVLGGVKMPIAVMTTSTIARAAGVALAWLNPAVRVFSETDFEGALDHLGTTGNDRRTLRDLVGDLRRELASRATAQRPG